MPDVLTVAKVAMLKHTIPEIMVVDGTPLNPMFEIALGRKTPN
jgi:hypothetical protein